MLLIPADDSKVALLLRPSAIVIQLLISDIEQGDGYWRGTTEDVLNLRFNVCVPLVIWDEPRRTLDPPLGDMPLSLSSSSNYKTTPQIHQQYLLTWTEIKWIIPKRELLFRGVPETDRQTPSDYYLGRGTGWRCGLSPSFNRWAFYLAHVTLSRIRMEEREVVKRHFLIVPVVLCDLWVSAVDHRKMHLMGIFLNSFITRS